MKFLGHISKHLALVVALLTVASSAFATVKASQYGYDCDADGKKIELRYSYSSVYVLDAVKIDGNDFLPGAKISVSRSDVTLEIPSYRDGKTLKLIIEHAPIYRLGTGSDHAMTCTRWTPPVTEKDDDRI